jgi:transglutaminase-like putative cysteine protease
MGIRISLKTFYFLTWGWLVGIALAIAYFSDISSAPLLLAASFFSLPSLFPRPRHRLLERFGLVTIAFAFVIVAVCLFDFRLEKDVVGLICGVLVALLPFTLWRKTSVSGNWMALLLVFLIAIAGLVIGNEAIDFLLFILFAVAFVFNLNAAHLYFHLGSFDASQTMIPRKYFPTFFYSVGMGMGIALAVFFLFPRSFNWVSPFGRNQKDKLTGYTGTIDLDGSSLQESNEIALRVEARDTSWLLQNSSHLYFRGNSVDQFDGTRWKNSRNDLQRFQNLPLIPFTRAFDRTLKFITVYREPSGGEWVIYPGILREIVGPMPFIRLLRYDSSGDFSRFSQSPGRYTYQLAVSLPAKIPQIDLLKISDLQKAYYPKDFGRYLAFPDSMRNADYFKRWVKEINLGEKPTVDKLLTQLDLEFHSRYKSTFHHQIPSSASFEYFLTQGREGHCEYFATAAALFLRQLGIPSRVVLGYFGGDFNTLSQVLEVRSSRAHAWVEFFVPDYGWIPYDPTPKLMRIFPNGFWDYASLYSSALKFWFDRYVVLYDRDAQVQLSKQLFSFRSSQWKKSTWFPSGQVLWILFGSLFFIFVGWRIRRRLRRRKRGFTVPSYYEAFRRRMQAKGFTRTKGETFAAFHQRLRGLGIRADLLDRVNEMLEKDLYSAQPTSPSQRHQFRRVLRAS